MGSLRAMVTVAAAYAAAAPPTVVMYETRRLDGDTYWRASYELAAAYALRHGHNFVLYTLPEGTARLDACDGSRLGPYWGKAAAAVQACIDFPDSSFFLLLDSDAAVSTTPSKTGDRWSDRPLEQILTAAAGWPNARSDVLVNQADRTYWLRRAPQNVTRWRYLLNSGTLAWKGTRGRQFVEAFWRTASSQEARGRNALGIDFTRAWPQDQYGLNMVANSREFIDDVAVVPMNRKYAADYATYKASVARKYRPPWPCLSGLPRHFCVIDHYCQHAKHKLGLIDAARREGLNSSVFRHVRALPTRGGFWGACDRL
jgi:hypothetical protein